MADDYADAVVALESAIDRACYQAEEVLTKSEIIAELRRIADQMEKEPA